MYREQVAAVCCLQATLHAAERFRLTGPPDPQHPQALHNLFLSSSSLPALAAATQGSGLPASHDDRASGCLEIDRRRCCYCWSQHVGRGDLNLAPVIEISLLGVFFK
jgi:hypothetical protein